MRPLIVVYAKAPIPGFVKTRLISSLGEEGATQLHGALVQDTLALANTLQGTFDLELHTDVATDAWSWTGGRGLQIAGDLGLRMYHTLRSALEAGRPFAMIVGSDSPTLPPEYLAQLAQLNADVCLGPARDGGFYAIGCRRTHPDMFSGVTWSAANTLALTERALHRIGLKAERGPEWFDIDEPADLDFLMQSGAGGRTGEVLRQCKRLCSR